MDSARQVVDAYIDRSGALDAAGLRACFAERAALHGYLGETAIAGEIGLYLADVERMAAAGVDMSGYRGEVTAIEVVGGVAWATVSMRGFAGAVFADMLHLMRGPEGWRIVAKTFTTLPAQGATS